MGSFYEDVKKHQNEICFFLAGVGIFLFIKYVIVYIMPFVIAGIYVFLLRKPLDFLHKKLKMGRGFLAGMSLFFLFLLLGILVWYAGGAFFCRLKQIVPDLTVYKKDVFLFVHKCCDSVEENFGIDAVFVESMVRKRINLALSSMEKDLLPQLLGRTFLYGKTLFTAFMFILSTLIAAILFAQDYERIIKKAQAVPLLREAKQLLKQLLTAVLKYVRAQIEIMAIISIICFPVFLFNAYSYAFLWAFVTGFLDMLPFIGTAMVFFPLAFFHIVKGQLRTALVFLTAFAITSIAREVLEPKLIGKRMGVWPIGILVSVYVGVKVFGVGGVLWGPLYLLILFELYKRIYPCRDCRDRLCD